MATNYGLLNDFSQGIKEGLIGLQTMKNQKRQEQQFNLLNNVEETPEGQLQLNQTGQALKQAQIDKANAEAMKARGEDVDSQAGLLAKGLMKTDSGSLEKTPEQMQRDAAETKRILAQAGYYDKFGESKLHPAEKVLKEAKIPQNAYTAATYGKRVEDANTQLESLINKPGFDVASQSTALKSKYSPELFKNNDIKLLEQSKRNFVNSVLRRESGAAIAPSEYESANKQYFPQPGDTKDVLEQKKRNREVALAGLKSEAGNAWGKVEGNLASADQKGLLSEQSSKNNGFKPGEVKKSPKDGKMYKHLSDGQWVLVE